MTSLEPLLDLQERDLALDRLRHRRATLPERAALVDAQATVVALTGEIEGIRSRRDVFAADERRLEAEAETLGAQAAGADQKLYSGEISSPKELQALQADVEQLKKHQRSVEDRQLSVMEQREPLDARMAELDAERAATEAEVEALAAALAAAEGEVDAEAAEETAARGGIAQGIDDGLIADYERRRVQNGGAGAARLVGMTCQGCHLSVPATEVDRIRHAPPGEVAYCDNCGCILVVTT